LNESDLPQAALVHDWLTGMRGGEKVLEELLALAPAAEIYTLLHLPGSVSPAIESRPIHTSFLQHAPAVASRYRYYLPLYPWAIESLRIRPVRLVISSSHAVAKGCRPPAGARHICYCHTPMRYAWDQQEVYFARDRGLVRWLRRRVLARLRAWDVRSSSRVDQFVANSRFVAERIRRFYGRDAEVVAPPVDTDFFHPGADTAPEAARCYALVVAALAPYKRVDLAIQACERLGIELRIVGTGPERAHLERLAQGATHFLGWVGAQELRQLYRGAKFLVQPGVEDFGIAPVEALACGTPVVAAGAGGVLDVVEPPRHGLFHRPEDLADLIQALDRIQQIEFNALNLRQRALTFSRERFARQMRQLIGENS
jgi:glycosyltransferase involved in cell wall biosynthesis